MSTELTSPHLPDVGLVAGLSKEDRDTLSSYGSFHIARTNDLLITQDEEHAKLFFIISGHLHARRRDDGREFLLGEIRQGEWVGEVNIFDPSAATATVVAVEDTQYWVITRKDLEDFINNYPAAGMQLVVGVASVLSKRLRALTKKMMSEAELAVARAALLGDLDR